LPVYGVAAYTYLIVYKNKNKNKKQQQQQQKKKKTLLYKELSCQVWWLIPLIPALGGQK